MEDLHLKSGVSSLTEIQNRFSSGKSERLGLSKDFYVAFSDERLSDDSKKLLISYNETYRRLFKNVIMFGSLNIESSELDYSLLITPLAKILETELNLTLMKWFRQNGKRDELDMYDDKGAVKSSFTLGEIYHISIREFDNGMIPHVISDTKDFLNILRKVRDFRNSAAHTGCTERANFEEFYELFSCFISHGYFEAILLIK